MHQNTKHKVALQALELWHMTMSYIDRFWRAVCSTIHGSYKRAGVFFHPKPVQHSHQAATRSNTNRMVRWHWKRVEGTETLGGDLASYYLL